MPDHAKTVQFIIKADKIIVSCNKFEIETEGHGKNTKLFIDGKRLMGARSLDLKVDCNSLPSLILEIIPSMLELKDNG